MAEKRLYHTVANDILELINSGAFPPGVRLPGERDLAKRFGVSRVAVREAEIALEAQGLIEIKVGSGAYVLDERTWALNFLPTVDPLELTEARALFEAESAALAAPVITDEALNELENYIAIMSGRVLSDMSADEADLAFHKTIARATNNHAIMFVIDCMWKMRVESAQLKNVYRKVCEQDSSHRGDEHNAVLDALRNRDSKAAREAMRTHFNRIIDALIKDSEEKAFEQVKRKAAQTRSRYMLTKQLS